jgi:hypothetical protein
MTDSDAACPPGTDRRTERAADDTSVGQEATAAGPDCASTELRLVDVYANAPADYAGTCLRPLGLCELGGACDSCWYNSNRPESLGSRPARPETKTR